MANFNFDLENAEIELGHISNLLKVFDEFYQNEAPAKDDERGAVLFARRVRDYYSLIESAHDKIDAIREEMETTINRHFEEAKKEAAI